MPDALRRIGDAMTAIVLDHPFFASLLLQMPRIADPGIQTACTNGIEIRYNPEFIESLTQDQVAGLLVHEVMHPALGHLHRLPPDIRGNIAGDYAINNFLDNYNRASGKTALELPPGGLIDHELDNLSAEEILRKLDVGELSVKVVPTEEREDCQGAWGEFEAQADLTEDDYGDDSGVKSRKRIPAAEMAAEWERRVVRAATAARMQRGTMPGCISKLVETIVSPAVPWPRLLERFLDNTAEADYSWHRPDRRFLSEDILIPEIHDTTLGEIVLAIDTSGSIFGNQEALASFEAEINSIIGNCRPERVILIHCDAKVSKVEEFGRGQPLKINAKGGGGTDFRPVGEWILERGISPRVCIYLTDLEGAFPEAPWDFPVIWCVYDNDGQEAPFGDTVHIPSMK